MLRYYCYYYYSVWPDETRRGCFQAQSVLRPWVANFLIFFIFYRFIFPIRVTQRRRHNSTAVCGICHKYRVEIWFKYTCVVPRVNRQAHRLWDGNDKFRKFRHRTRLCIRTWFARWFQEHPECVAEQLGNHVACVRFQNSWFYRADVTIIGTTCV